MQALVSLFKQLKHSTNLVYLVIIIIRIKLSFFPGKLPLHQLVYRVLDLPPSMRPLVFDFGQLNLETESDYIRQIVHDHVRTIQKLCIHS